MPHQYLREDGSVMLALISGPVAKGSAIDLEVAVSGLVHSLFPLHLSFSPRVVHNIDFRVYIVQ